MAHFTRRRLLSLAAAGPLYLAPFVTRVAQSKEGSVKRIFITGSTDGLGRAAAVTLINEGHQVVLHARSKARAAALADLAPKSAGVVIGDLASADEVRALAEQVNKKGRMDAIIHNAGIYHEATRGKTPEGHARILAVNTLAPYMLTELIQRPERLIYLSSSMHFSGEPTLDDIDWNTRRWKTDQAYSDSKLHVTALALALARKWPKVFSNAVDPGWVPTRMGGASASDDLEQGHLTQSWLAVSEEPAARVSGKYWYHRQPRKPAAAAADAKFQDELLAKLAKLTGVTLS
jgi:NAD(P)-dependent dehydrogenase (short-subunit alcohol dehydrogenase family)